MPVPALILLVATIADPGSVVTPSTAPSDSSPILVQGARDRDREISRFIKDLTPSYAHGQLSRFEGAVCPRVFGLLPEYNQLVADRMRAVAAAADIRVGKPGCQANVVVIVANDKAEFLRRAAKERYYIFPREWSGATVRALAKDPSPAVAWTVEDEHSSDGVEFDYSREAPLNRQVGALSRLRPTSRHYFLASVLVVQADALDSFSTRQFADYAAMRTFVRTDPARVKGSSSPTILSLLDTPMGEAAPLSLTEWDLSFLKSFYGSRLNYYTETQRAEMKGKMRRELERQRAKQQ